MVVPGVVLMLVEGSGRVRGLGAFSSTLFGVGARSAASSRAEGPAPHEPPANIERPAVGAERDAANPADCGRFTVPAAILGAVRWATGDPAPGSGVSVPPPRYTAVARPITATDPIKNQATLMVGTLPHQEQAAIGRFQPQTSNHTPEGSKGRRIPPKSHVPRTAGAAEPPGVTQLPTMLGVRTPGHGPSDAPRRARFTWCSALLLGFRAIPTLTVCERLIVGPTRTVPSGRGSPERRTPRLRRSSPLSPAPHPKP